MIASASKLVQENDFANLSDADIRKKVVTAVRGEAAVLGKSPAYINAAFDLAVETHSKNPDPVRKALIGRDTRSFNQDHGQTAYEKRIATAWKSIKEPR